MRTTHRHSLLILLLVACAPPPPTHTWTSPLTLGTAYYPDTFVDELCCQSGWPTTGSLPMLMTGCSINACNNQCSLRESVIAGQADRAVDSCPAGVPPSIGQDAAFLFGTSQGTYSLSTLRRLNLGSDFAIVGDDNDWSTLDPGRMDRSILLSGNLNTTLRSLRFINGCPGGPNTATGDCRSNYNASEPMGGAVYVNAIGTFDASNIECGSGNEARGGSCISVCAAPTGLTATLDTILAHDGVSWAAGGAFLSHVDATFRNITVWNNRNRGGGSTGGAGFEVYGGIATLQNVSIHDNVSEQSNGAGLNVHGVGGPGVVRVDLIDSSIVNNTARGHGGGIYVGDQCPATGCLVTATRTTISGNVASSMNPQGNGGNTATGAGGRIEAYDGTAILGGVDNSTPNAPDCTELWLYGTSTLGTSQGCTLHDMRNVQLCGNGVLDAGEQCDGGPMCRADCTFMVCACPVAEVCE